MSQFLTISAGLRDISDTGFGGMTFPHANTRVKWPDGAQTGPHVADMTNDTINLPGGLGDPVTQIPVRRVFVVITTRGVNQKVFPADQPGMQLRFD